LADEDDKEDEDDDEPLDAADNILLGPGFADF
jgi:hypothetical protein